MFRTLILASAVSLTLFPGSAVALGLGGLRAQSALNEPFAGQIDLLDVTPDQIDTVKVLLASVDEFDKVGAPRPQFLTGLSFTPGVSPQGSPVILISSTEPVREPYLDFLIEVNSPAGRMVKEYTVLLDPPVTLDSPPPRASQPAIVPPAPQQAALRESPPRQEAAPAPSSAYPSAFPMRYGPIESGEGLWGVARKMARSSGASVAQTAMALYRSNPQAFIRGDINGLMVGKVLEIPTSAELLALDAGEADREFNAALRGESVDSKPLADSTAAPGPEDRLTIAGADKPVSPTQAQPQASPEVPPAEITPEDRAAPGTAVAEAAAQVGEQAVPYLGAIKQDLLLVQEASESTRQETTELRGRIRELETQLEDIQRLLKISNERFAQLQAAGLELRESPELDGTEEVPTGDAVDPAGAPGQADSPEAAAVSTPGAAPAAEPKPDAGLGAPGSGAHTGFWASIPRPVGTWAVAIPLLILVLGWMIYKRRKSLEQTPKPGEPASVAPAVEAAVAAPSDRSAARSAESAAVSAPVQSTYSGFASEEDETEESDIISEADVYIAYGRYREAESLLEQEVERSPDRLDVKCKLAEAYYGAGNLTGMEAIMSQMQRIGADPVNLDQWRRLDRMLQDLKADDADVPGTSAVGDETHAETARNSTQPTDAVFPPPPDPASLKHGFPGAEEVLTAVPATADSQARDSRDLKLEVEDLEVISDSLRPPASEETPEMSGAVSDLELQLEDLESLRDLDLASITDQMSSSPPRSAGSETPLPAEAEGDPPGDTATAGKDSHTLSTQWQIDSGMWDEVATKIDLARAYMEMEDPEAARVILEEVEQEGNRDQRTKAREMMEQLG